MGRRVANRTRIGTEFLFFGALLASGFGSTHASADAVETFYRDKQITLLIGYPPGGGYDSFARALVRHISKYIPGRPTVIPKNMPGAGSLNVANYLAAAAPRDGTEFAALGREIPTIKLFGDKKARFTATELNWLGNAESAATFCGSWFTSGVTSPLQLFDTPLLVGGTASDSSTVTIPFALNALLGTKFKPIAGYPGGAELHLALQRGEIHGRCAWSWSSLLTAGPTWVEEGKVRILLGLGLVRDPKSPDVPTAMELTDDPAKKQALELVLSQSILTRPFAAPPGLRPDRLGALRRAFDQTMTDPDFLSDVERQKLEVSPMGGAEMATLIARLNLTPQTVVDLAVNAMKPTSPAAGEKKTRGP
jgi:tripartite-type tricarboxylate transporter receptor subunit TctC